MLELSEAVQQLIDRTTQQVVHEAKIHQASASVLNIEGDYTQRSGSSAAPWTITWDTK